MELRNDNGPDPRRRVSMARAAQSGVEQVAENISEARARRETQVREALERVSRVREAHATRVAHEQMETREVADKIELSETGRLFAGETEEAARASAERAEKVETLREAFEGGSLNTDERIEEAAHKLLGGE